MKRPVKKIMNAGIFIVLFAALPIVNAKRHRPYTIQGGIDKCVCKDGTEVRGIEEALIEVWELGAYFGHKNISLLLKISFKISFVEK